MISHTDVAEILGPREFGNLGSYEDIMKGAWRRNEEKSKDASKEADDAR